MYIIKIFNNQQECRNDKINSLINDDDDDPDQYNLLGYHDESHCWIRVNDISSVYVFKNKKDAEKLVKEYNDSKDIEGFPIGIFWYLSICYFTIIKINKKKLNNLVSNSINNQIKYLTEEYNKQKLELKMKRDRFK